MKQKASMRPIGFNLLPEFIYLNSVAESLRSNLWLSIDKRNFRKKVAEMSFIEQTELIDKK